MWDVREMSKYLRSASKVTLKRDLEPLFLLPMANKLSGFDFRTPGSPLPWQKPSTPGSPKGSAVLWATRVRGHVAD